MLYVYDNIHFNYKLKWEENDLKMKQYNFFLNNLSLFDAFGKHQQIHLQSNSWLLSVKSSFPFRETILTWFHFCSCDH